MPRSCWSIQNKLGGIFVGVWHHFALQICKTFFFFGLVSLLLVYSGFHFLVFLCVLFYRERERSWVGGGGGEELGEVEGRESMIRIYCLNFFSMKKQWGRRESTSPQ